VLTFPAQLDVGRTHASVVGPAGGIVVSGAPKVDGAMLRLPMETTRPGRYLTGYHVTFEDGSEASGQVGFTVDTCSPVAVESGTAGTRPVERRSRAATATAELTRWLSW
jgi:hypothetical protein